MTCFDFDNNDNLYVLFISFPVVQKYDKNYHLIYERNISYLPEVQESIKAMEKMKKGSPSSNIFWILLGICVFPNGDYLIHSGNLYHFSSNGFPVQKIGFYAYGISLQREKYLFRIDMDRQIGWVIKKYLYPWK